MAEEKLSEKELEKLPIPSSENLMEIIQQVNEILGEMN